MRTIGFLDGRLGMEVGQYLRRRADLCGIVLHPDATRHYIRPADFDRDTSIWVWPDGLDEARAHEPDCLVSVLFGYRIPEQWRSIASWGAINLHPGFLPANRGRAASAWPLIDGSAAGATLHFMEEEFDSGPMLGRELVPTYPEDTGATVWQRVESAALVLFRNAWPRVQQIEAVVQDNDGASYHSLRDVDNLELSDDDMTILNRMRAKTHDGHGIRLDHCGRSYDVTVSIQLVGPTGPDVGPEDFGPSNDALSEEL